MQILLAFVEFEYKNDANAEWRIMERDTPNIQLYGQNNRIEGLKSSYKKQDLFADVIEFEIYNTWNDIF